MAKTATPKDETRDVPAVQQAMKRLTQYINASDAEIKRLTQAEAHLSSRVGALSTQLNSTEQRLLDSREEVRRLNAKEKQLESEIRDLRSRAEKGDDNLRRRAEDAEQRAATYGQQNEELVDKADLGERLSEASRKMVDAIERLPEKMEDAAVIRGTSPLIPLYGTYEWQAVSDARFEILRALGEPTEDMGG